MNVNGLMTVDVHEIAVLCIYMLCIAVTVAGTTVLRCLKSRRDIKVTTQNLHASSWKFIMQSECMREINMHISVNKSKSFYAHLQIIQNIKMHSAKEDIKNDEPSKKKRNIVKTILNPDANSLLLFKIEFAWSLNSSCIPFYMKKRWDEIKYMRDDNPECSILMIYPIASVHLF